MPAVGVLTEFSADTRRCALVEGHEGEHLFDLPKVPPAQPAARERITVGDEYLSITITRKASGDLIVSQWALQRWFADGEEVARAVEEVVEAVVARVGCASPRVEGAQP